MSRMQLREDFYVCDTRVRRIILNFAEKGGRYGEYKGQVRQV